VSGFSPTFLSPKVQIGWSFLMIPLIGVMIGAYILTRMAELVTRNKEQSAGTVTNVMAALTIVLTLFVIISLLTTGADVASQMRLLR